MSTPKQKFQLVDPNAIPVFDFKQKETVDASGDLLKTENAVVVEEVPILLPHRKIFLYFEAKIAPEEGDFGVNCELRFYLKNALVGRLPAGLGLDTSTPGRLKDSLFTVFGNPSAGGSDCGLLSIAGAFYPDHRRILLAPFYIYSACDTIKLAITGVANLVGSGSSFTGYRAFVGVVSSNFSFQQ